MAHEDVTLEEQETIQQLGRIVAQEIARGGNREAIIRQLIKKGVPEHSAREFVIDVGQMVEDVIVSPETAGPEVQEALAYIRAQPQQMARGLLIVVLGILIALAAFNSIPQLPDMAVLVFAAPVLFGGFEFLSGFIGWWRLRT